MKKKQIVRAAILNDSESDVEIPNEIVEKVLKKKSKAKPIVEQSKFPYKNLNASSTPSGINEQPEKPAPNFRPSFNFV